MGAVFEVQRMAIWTSQKWLHPHVPIQPLVQNIVCTRGDSQWQKHTHMHTVCNGNNNNLTTTRPYLNTTRLSQFGIHCVSLSHMHTLTQAYLSSQNSRIQITFIFHQLFFLVNSQRLCSPFFLLQPVRNDFFQDQVSHND